MEKQKLNSLYGPFGSHDVSSLYPSIIDEEYVRNIQRYYDLCNSCHKNLLNSSYGKRSYKGGFTYVDSTLLQGVKKHGLGD